MIINSTPVKLPIREYLSLTDWDKQKSRCKGKGFSYLNNRLEKQEQEIKDFVNKHIAIGKLVTIDMIKRFYNKEDFLDFYGFYKTFTERKFESLTKGSQYHYTLLCKIMKEYKPVLRLDSIDLNFIEEFDYYLMVTRKTGLGGRANKHKKLKAILGSAYRLKLIKSNPYQDFKIKEPAPRTVFLTTKELSELEELDLSKRPNIELTRDKFLFSCYTGLRFSDMNYLKWEDTKNGMIDIVMIKTKNPVKIPLTKKAKKLLCKYVKKKTNEFVFKEVSNQKINYGLKKIGVIVNSKKRLTYHVARHTFGSLLAQSDVSPFYIMKLMGHQNIGQTATYVNANTKMLRETMKNVNF
ncbi:hypothetical protein A8C32_01990 [Flavivirga aquatica]|uniref:Tyr recombinase domain-containing protein n=1 Tax=Flavivirga aquatica TaxID=1849968 RepID=A0A1E5TA43_9FLAO|nr:hypothetical protein A8C32_01990 [Flavivirga aquatica]